MYPTLDEINTRKEVLAKVKEPLYEEIKKINRKIREIEVEQSLINHLEDFILTREVNEEKKRELINEYEGNSND